MKKSTYIFICFLLSVNLWNIVFITNIVSGDMILLLTWLWAGLAFVVFPRKKRNPLYKIKYTKYVLLIFLGVFISMFSARFFGKQEFMTTFFAQRWIYSFVLLPSLLYIQPTERDIFKPLKWITYCTMVVWLFAAINPALVFSEDASVVEKSESDFGYYVKGIYFVVFYFYVKAHQLIRKFDKKILLEYSFLLGFIFLYQNRSMLLGAVGVLLYTLFKFRSRNRKVLLTALAVLLVVVIFFTKDIWLALLTESQSQLSNPDYNRIKALYYYFFEYSPNWFCYVFGNGFPSGGNSPLGNLMWNNFELGIYASDLGLLGMWTDYGIIPVLTVYFVVFSVLLQKKYPLYLKFICFHILFVPTIFHFWSNPGVFLFVLIFYLFAYNKERYKFNTQYAINNHSQLQKRK